MQALSKAEIRALLEAARAESERDWLMILVAYSHGLRASEVVALTRDNVKDGMLTVKRLKGSLRTRQPLVSDPDPLFSEVPALEQWALNFHRNQKLFPVTRQTFWNVLQRAGKQAKLPAHKRHPHILKHSIAMQVIQNAGIENTRQYLGHKSMSSTGAYLKVSDEAASAAVARALGGTKKV